MVAGEGTAVTQTAPALVGREPEIASLERLVDGLEAGGGSVIVRGDPGIGKSALLRHATALARRRGVRILSTTGVESETHLPYSGLHQLLRPILSQLDELAAPQRGSLSAAFGMQEPSSPDTFLTALAALNLLGEAATAGPILLVVEDAHWLDRPSAEVVAFVARRLDADPIGLLAASRDARDGPLDQAGPPELRVERLDDASAAALLDDHAPELPTAVRERILEDAAGNPLALVELPVAYASRGRGDKASLPRWLPLTTRLEQAFAARVSELPVESRAALLVAAVDDDGVLGEILDAASALTGEAEATVELLQPAIGAGLVEVEDGAVRFRHPLVRSAIHQSAGLAQRHAAHAALAEVLADQPDRRVWHQAVSSTKPSEDVASALEDAAAQAQRRGATVVAVTALERAAQLSADAGAKGRRLLSGAELAQELGRQDLMTRLLAQAEKLELGRLDRTRMLWLREELDEKAWSGSDRVQAFVEIAEEFRRGGEPQLALSCLLTVGLRLWWSNPDQQTRDLVVAAAERIPVAEDDPALLAVLAYADPIKRGAVVIDRISRMAPEAEHDPAAAYLVGSAATGVWAHDIALDFLGVAADGLRAQGRLGLLARALVSQAWAAIHLAKETLAAAAADEAFRLARESHQPRWAVAAQLAQATIAAERGDFATADALAGDAEAILMEAGANPMLALVQFTRGRGAVAHRRYEEGLEHHRRLLDPDDIAYHPYVGAWALSDLVEAAVHLGKRDSATGYLAELEWLTQNTPGNLLRAELGYARPLVADDSSAEPLYRTALASDLMTWPCYRGRLLLAYGRWLRRQRRVAESRAPLRAARETFDALAFRALAESAREELRASGETSRRRTPDARDRLSPQELQIAQMAAAGMTNKEIGQRLYLSHRTVGSHLYRMFPKLGISARSELRDVVEPPQRSPGTASPVP